MDSLSWIDCQTLRNQILSFRRDIIPDSIREFVFSLADAHDQVIHTVKNQE